MPVFASTSCLDPSRRTNVRCTLHTSHNKCNQHAESPNADAVALTLGCQQTWTDRHAQLHLKSTFDQLSHPAAQLAVHPNTLILTKQGRVESSLLGLHHAASAGGHTRESCSSTPHLVLKCAFGGSRPKTHIPSLWSPLHRHSDSFDSITTNHWPGSCVCQSFIGLKCMSPA